MNTRKHTIPGAALTAIALLTAGALHAEVPTPDPPTFEVAPTADGETVITMTAAVPTSPLDVEYYFTETSGNPGGDDSGWQDSPTYIDGGLEPGTSYTYTVKTRDFNVIEDETTESPGASATTAADNGSNALVYEPFAYEVGPLNGAAGAYEMGLEGAWEANGATPVDTPSLAWGDLPTAGEAIIHPSQPFNTFGGARSISASALADNGLLDDGAVLWFSAISGYNPAGGNRTNTRLHFQFAPETLKQGNYDFYFVTPGAQGVGFGLGRMQGQNGRITALSCRDGSYGMGNNALNTGMLFGSDSPVLSNDNPYQLIVGKLTWAEDPSEADKIELFLPATNLAFPDPLAPHSTLEVVVDQTTFDTISWTKSEALVLDEIRFGATYNDVIDADVVTTPDTAPPAPELGAFAVAPTALDDDRITMTAAVADDPSGVEYYFAETSGNPGGDDSGWQVKPTYTDDGLEPSTLYTYTVQVRDMAVANNTGTASAAESVTTPAVDFNPPTPNPMTFAVNPAAVTDTSITMTATTATDDTYLVEYLFTNTTLGTNSGWQSSETWIDTELDPSTTYNYTVTARDTGPLNNAGTASDPVAGSTVATDTTAPTPVSWATAPTAVSDTEITMTATTATDDQYDVEYYFANLSVPDGSHDSGWQDSPTYSDTGLNPYCSYTYEFRVRDTSYAQNEAIAEPAPAVTQKPAGVAEASLLEGLFYTVGSSNKPNPLNGPEPSANFDVSVVDGKAIYSGVGNWPNQNQAGSWFIYNFFGDGTVADYRFFGPDATGPVAYATGPGGIIADVTSPDDSLGNLNQADVWETTDPGYDFTLNPADFTNPTGISAIQIFHTDPEPGISGTIDIAGMNEGIIYFVYGGYRLRPEVNVTMSGPGQTDVVLANVGDDDSANNNENYVYSVGFINAGEYDTISYNVNYIGNSGGGSNGRFYGIVVDGEIMAIPSDYEVWAGLYPGADLTDPDADLDGDSLSNDTERLFGLDPTSAASVNPITVPLDAAAGTLSFTRRDDALTGLFSGIETSTDLLTWTRDTGAVLTPGDPDVNSVETVAVELSAGLLTAPKLFVRVVQDDGSIYSENFEASNGGFSPSGTPNDWAHGVAASDNTFGLMVTGGNGNPEGKCWGTALGDGASPSGLINTDADSILRSPDINLTSAAGAELSFAAAIDASGDDSLEVVVREVGTDAPLETIMPITGETSTNWTGYGPFNLGTAAGKNVYLEFRFQGTNNTYIGFYIDDVSIKQTMP